MRLVHTRNDPIIAWECLVTPRSEKRRREILARKREKKKVALPPKVGTQQKKTSIEIPVSNECNLYASERKDIVKEYKEITIATKVIYGPYRPSLKQVAEKVAEKHSLSVKEIQSQTRMRHVIKARHEFFYLARVEARTSYYKIGQFCGKRDHSTVMSGAKKYADSHDLPAPEPKRNYS
jgi:chromosomal replication initiation ATPase DnaA